LNSGANPDAGRGRLVIASDRNAGAWTAKRKLQASPSFKALPAHTAQAALETLGIGSVHTPPNFRWAKITSI
jgi:hypothetical protein